MRVSPHWTRTFSLCFLHSLGRLGPTRPGHRNELAVRTAQPSQNSQRGCHLTMIIIQLSVKSGTKRSKITVVRFVDFLERESERVREIGGDVSVRWINVYLCIFALISKKMGFQWRVWNPSFFRHCQSLWRVSRLAVSTEQEKLIVNHCSTD